VSERLLRLLEGELADRTGGVWIGVCDHRGIRQNPWKVLRSSAIRSKVCSPGRRSRTSLRLRASAQTPRSAPSRPATIEESVPKPNYRQAKKQKEASRKARQLEKQQRRAARPNDSGDAAAPLQDASAAPAAPSDPTLSSGT
jgi:hypothetical protein